jgi:hypothetical protein
MSLAAISNEIAQIFAPPPSTDWASLISDDLKNFERMVDRFETEMTTWRANTTAKAREGLDKLRGLAAELPKSVALEIFTKNLADAQAQLDEALKSYSVPLHENPDIARLLSTVTGLAPSSSKFLRKQFRRVERVRVANYNALVDWHYALLAFLSEFEPDGERGPAFSDADDFEKFVRRSLA